MKKDKAFIQTKNFPMGGDGRHHVLHCLREKVNKNFPNGFDIKVFGDKNDILTQATPLSKKSKNLFFEVMVSAYADDEKNTEKDTLKIKSFLEDYFQGRKVLSIEHRDEAKFHSHHLIAWNNSEGRALRISPKEIRALKEEIAHITGQSLTPQGMGRKHLQMQEVDKLKAAGVWEEVQTHLNKAQEIKNAVLSPMSAQKFVEQKKPILPIAPAVIGKTMTNAQKFADGDAKAGVMIGLTAAKIGFNVLDKVKDMMPPIVALSTPTAQPEPPVSIQDVEKESIVETAPQKAGLGDSITKDLTDHVIDEQHGIAPSAPKPAEYSAQAENVVPSKSEDKPVVAAPAVIPPKPKKPLEQQLREEIEKCKYDIALKARKPGADTRVMYLSRNATDDEIKKAAKFVHKKRGEGFSVKTSRAIVFSPLMGGTPMPKHLLEPAKAVKKFKDKIDPAPPQQEQQVETVRIPFTPGR